MKVIDLLNKIANEENIPDAVMFWDREYILDKEFINDDFDKNFAEYNAINAYLDTTGDKYAYYLSAEEYEKRVIIRKSIISKGGFCHD